LHLEIFYSILVTSVGIPIVSYTSGLRGILEGYEDFQSINIIKIILGVLNFMIPMLSGLLFGSSLIYIAVSLLLTRILVLFLHFLYLNKIVRITRIYSKGKVISRKTLLEIYKFGSWMTISNVLSSLMVNADRFLLSYLLGAATIAYYTVPFDLAIRALIVPAAFSATLFPRFSNLISSNPEAAWSLLIVSKQKMLKVMFAMCGLMVLFSYLGLSFWINSDFANKSWLYLCILCLGIFFNGLSNLPYAFLQAYGKVKLTALLHLVEFVFYMIVLYFLVKNFGIVGAAYAFVIRVFIDYVLLNIYTKKINLN
jgi:O-antigen/teichoic acid export membrane protein